MTTIGGGAPILSNDVSSRFKIAVIVIPVLTTISTICVGLRFLSRRLHASVGADDWFSLGALVFAYGYLVSIMLRATIGHAGYRLARFTPTRYEVFLKLFFAENIMYSSSICCSKLSLLILYRRIFGTLTSFRRWVWCFVFIAIAFWLEGILVLVFAFNPIEAQWKWWLPHTNIDVKLFWVLGGALNVVIDFAILCLPQRQVWRLHMSHQRRALLSMLLLMGFLVCVISALRTAFLEAVDFEDETYAAVTAALWTNAELNLSMICGCGPVLPALFRHWPSSNCRDNTRKWFGQPATRIFDCLRASKDSSSSARDSRIGPYVRYEKNDVSPEFTGSRNAVNVRMSVEITERERDTSVSTLSNYGW